MKTTRKATPDDAPGILGIYAPFVTDTAVTFELDVPELSDFAERIATILRQYPYLVCEEDGKILGYAYATALRERKAYQWCAELTVYVDPACRGCGIGFSLYSALIEILSVQNIHSVYGCVTTPNPASEALHARLGFVSAGVFYKSGFKLGQWRDVAWFVKHLLDYENAPQAIIPFPDVKNSILASIFRAQEAILNA